MYLDYMSTCGAASDLAHVGLQVSPRGLGEHLPTGWMGSSTLCLAKTFYVHRLSLHMTSVQQAKLLEHFSRKLIAVQQRRTCNVKAWAQTKVLSGFHTLGWIYLVIQVSGMGLSLPPGPRCHWVSLGWVDSAKCALNCLLCCLSPPPKTGWRRAREAFPLWWGVPSAPGMDRDS